MEYHGKLYGKIGNKYFDTGKTSSDFDNTSHQIEKLEAEKKELLEALEMSNTAMLGCDWSENKGSPHLIPIYKSNESLIKKRKAREIK